MADAIHNFGGLMDESVISDMFSKLLDMIEPIARDCATFLEEQGVTEEQLMLSPQAGLSDENQALWKEGALTIGDILGTQPEIILRNE